MRTAFNVMHLEASVLAAKEAPIMQRSPFGERNIEDSLALEMKLLLVWQSQFVLVDKRQTLRSVQHSSAISLCLWIFGVK